MEKYFTKFPEMYYQGLRSLDITRRVRIDEKQRNNINLFNPLELKSSLRADHISDAYYEDAELDWMVYLSNEIIDPYYGWYLNEHDFNSFIDSKYGSFEQAIKKIKYYKNNWAADSTQLTVSFYNNNLANNEKQYWSPVYGQGANIISYTRKRQDWVMNTNRILKYSTFGSNNSFTLGEIVDIKHLGETVGGGEVIESNSSEVFIYHVTGNTIANTTWTKTIVGETSNNSVTTNNMVIVKENISNAESKYWRAVTQLDWEIDQNENKKVLNIVDQNVAFDLAESLRLRLKE